MSSSWETGPYTLRKFGGKEPGRWDRMEGWNPQFGTERENVVRCPYLGLLWCCVFGSQIVMVRMYYVRYVTALMCTRDWGRDVTFSSVLTKKRRDEYCTAQDRSNRLDTRPSPDYIFLHWLDTTFSTTYRGADNRQLKDAL